MLIQSASARPAAAGLSHDAFQRLPAEPAARSRCRLKLVELAQTRRRFGYRRLHDRLRKEFTHVNHKRVYWLYYEAN